MPTLSGREATIAESTTGAVRQSRLARSGQAFSTQEFSQGRDRPATQSAWHEPQLRRAHSFRKNQAQRQRGNKKSGTNRDDTAEDIEITEPGPQSHTTGGRHDGKKLSAGTCARQGHQVTRLKLSGHRRVTWSAGAGRFRRRPFFANRRLTGTGWWVSGMEPRESQPRSDWRGWPRFNNCAG